jgi:hypothetical protein
MRLLLFIMDFGSLDDFIMIFSTEQGLISKALNVVGVLV